MKKPLLLLIFILITYLLLDTPQLEFFKNKKSNKIKKSKTKNNKKKNKENFKRDRREREQEKENFIVHQIMKLVSPEESQKLKNELKKREEKRNKIMAKSSKNTNDTMKKFNALKEGFFDIIKIGTNLTS